MLVSRDPLFGGPGATLAVAQHRTPFVHVRGCYAALVAFRCTTTQTGNVTPNWSVGESADDAAMLENTGLGDYVVTSSGAISPAASNDWFYTGLRGTGGLLVNRWARCRLVVATADLTNLEAYLIRIWREDPAQREFTDEQLRGLGIPALVPAP